MTDTTLVVLAAGIGSRYGAGIKQLERVGCCGEIIIDYSIYDAIKAGFNKIVFIIRKDIEQEFKSVIGDRISKLIDVEYVFQDVKDLPAGTGKFEERTKPWGTGHALWCCRNVVKEPFAVINADDFYGSLAYSLIHDELVSSSGRNHSYCMAGFVLGNTLSDNGSVTRGICKRDDTDMMISCEETYKIRRVGDIAVGMTEDGTEKRIEPDAVASMNMWGLTPDIFDILDKGFSEFLRELGTKEEEKRMKAEYLLPNVIGELLRRKAAKVKILDTHDRWYGITYESDKAEVSRALQRLTEEGQYNKPVFGGMDER